MSTLTTTDTATATDVNGLNTQLSAATMYNGKATEQAVNSTTKRIRDTKYRHVFATHSQQRKSCLSHDAEKTPSFVGFRNLMILVLSAHSSLASQSKAC